MFGALKGLTFPSFKTEKVLPGGSFFFNPGQGKTVRQITKAVFPRPRKEAPGCPGHTSF
jgi:hypothetical protein